MAVRRLTILLLLAFCLASTGCALVSDATHVAGQRTFESIRECLERQRNCHWAEEVWQKEAAQQNYSADYAKGFKAGFAEHLYRGGNGEPPVLPPEHYRALKYQTPEGQGLVFDWFAGYRHGATIAQQSGFRQLVTGPANFGAIGTHAPPPDFHQDALPHEIVVPREVLPTPREKPLPPGPNSKVPPLAQDIVPVAKVERVVVTEKARPELEVPTRVIRLRATENFKANQGEEIATDGPMLPDAPALSNVLRLHAPENIAAERDSTEANGSPPGPPSLGGGTLRLPAPRQGKCWNP